MLGSMDSEFLTFFLKQTHFGQNSISLLPQTGGLTCVPYILSLSVSRPQQVFGWKCAEGMEGTRQRQSAQETGAVREQHGTRIQEGQASSQDDRKKITLGYAGKTIFG